MQHLYLCIFVAAIHILYVERIAKDTAGHKALISNSIASIRLQAASALLHLGTSSARLDLKTSRPQLDQPSRHGLARWTFKTSRVWNGLVVASCYQHTCRIVSPPVGAASCFVYRFVSLFPWLVETNRQLQGFRRYTH